MPYFVAHTSYFRKRLLNKTLPLPKIKNQWHAASSAVATVEFVEGRLGLIPGIPNPNPRNTINKPIRRPN
jgi:hypothetical protein